MDINRLYHDFGVITAPFEHKHYRDGWVNTECPFCFGNPGYHLGFCTDPSSKYFNSFVCWRCGGKRTWEVLAKLLKTDEHQAIVIGSQYGTIIHHIPRKRKAQTEFIRDIKLPPGTRTLFSVRGAVAYLEKRGFNPRQIAQDWGIAATGPNSIVNIERNGKRISVDYSYRIIIPITYKNKTVTYQGRDWTGKSSKKYLACLPDLESKPIKHVLYGIDKCEGRKEVELVEGVTDVWNIGIGSVACFGIKYVQEQVRLLLKFERVGLMFDPEPQAKQQARMIARYLQDHGIETLWRRLPKGKDPGELTEQEKTEVLK